VDANGLRRAAAAAAKAAGSNTSLVIDHAAVTGSLDDPAAVTQALGEGAALAGYRFDRYRSADGDHLARVTIVGTGDRTEAAGLARARVVADAVCFARDLVNEPGGTLVPAEFADRVRDAATEAGLGVTVWGLEEIAEERLGGVLAVNKGSGNEARFVRLEYRPEGAVGHVALVGKGITFDSGGLSLKTGEGMMTMKCDMAGAAAVVATMCALPALGVPVAVTSFTPLTDNMTGDDAQRPGDVFTARNGTTVEVLNTDAEGRLVLADALSLASEEQPDAIVDLATLTGACMVALGDKVAGILSTDDELSAEIRAAADSVGEALWPLPLVEDYRKLLDSPVADLKNIGGRYGGTITAGLFLREFVADGIPWAHLDIAGPAFSDDAPPDGPKGATGYGVRTLLAFLEARAAARSASADDGPE
jgi:leucyl aminopeptidase